MGHQTQKSQQFRVAFHRVSMDNVRRFRTTTWRAFAPGEPTGSPGTPNGNGPAGPGPGKMRLTSAVLCGR